MKRTENRKSRKPKGKSWGLVVGLLLCMGYKKDIFAVFAYGFELS